MNDTQSRPTPTVEDYLGAIYTLSRDGETVIGRKLADWLEVSAPTVTGTLQRMIRDGWVTMSRDKSIQLTEAGRGAAAAVVRRHMLTELLLARVLGLPWSRVHEEADRIEHDLSSETAERVAEIVQYPEACPHGNPMPGHEGSTDDLLPLLEAEEGGTYRLERVHEEIERNADLMAYLERQCLVPGSVITIVDLMPFNETVTLRSAGEQTVLGLVVARKLWVSELQVDSARVASGHEQQAT